MSSPVDLAACLRAGLFGQALKFLDTRRNLSLVDRVDRLEILHYSGETRQAAREARALLSERGLSAVEASRCTIVLADEAGYSGDFAQAVAFYHKALSSAEQTDNVKQICVAGTLVLERTSDATGFDSSVSLASRVRKLAVRSGDAHLSVTTHLTFGRLEGKAGHFDVARRHFGIARESCFVSRMLGSWLRPILTSRACYRFAETLLVRSNSLRVVGRRPMTAVGRGVESPRRPPWHFATSRWATLQTPRPNSLVLNASVSIVRATDSLSRIQKRELR